MNQADSNLFNRAMLLNVGFEEAMSDRNWTCAIFHDVDLLPEDDRNIYSCPEQPRHVSFYFNVLFDFQAYVGGSGQVQISTPLQDALWRGFCHKIGSVQVRATNDY